MDNSNVTHAKKPMLTYAVIALVAAGVGFGGGMTYAKSSKVRALGAQGNAQFFRADGAAMMGGQARGGVRGVNGGTGAAGGFVNGEVLSKDDKSITVKLRDGGSKIIFTAESTTVSRPSDIKIGELNVGDNVMVMGKANDDGSVTAESIQIRPAGTVPARDGSTRQGN